MDFTGGMVSIIIVALILLACWWWLSWVAIGMLIVYWALPSDIIMHAFLWVMANSLLGGAIKFNKS